MSTLPDANWRFELTRHTIQRLVDNLSGRTLVRPKHLSRHNIDHDYYFEFPRGGAGDSISIAVIDFTPYTVISYPAYEPIPRPAQNSAASATSNTD